MQTQRLRRSETIPDDVADLRLAALLALLRQKDGEPRAELLGRLGHLMRELARHEALIEASMKQTPISMEVLDDMAEKRHQLLSSLSHLARHLDKVIDLCDDVEDTYVDLTAPF